MAILNNQRLIQWIGVVGTILTGTIDFPIKYVAKTSIFVFPKNQSNETWKLTIFKNGTLW